VPLDLRGVVLTSLTVRDGRLDLRVLESGRPAADALTFVSGDAPRRDWCRCWLQIEGAPVSMDVLYPSIAGAT
jgi:hypothetical protein